MKRKTSHFNPSPLDSSRPRVRPVRRARTFQSDTDWHEHRFLMVKCHAKRTATQALLPPQRSRDMHVCLVAFNSV
jgi:hypothetical protein